MLNHHQMDDHLLLALIGMQNQAALEALYDRYVRQVYSLVLSILRDPYAAEDVAQEVFFSVWKRATSFNAERGRPATWLLSIAHHRAIDALRRQRRRDARETPLDQEGEAFHTRSTDPGPVEITMLLDDREQIREALQKLPLEQQRVIVLAYFQGLTQVEISELLKQPLGTVKTRIRLGLAKLRQSMGPWLGAES